MPVVEVRQFASLLVAGALALCTVDVAAGEMYRWTDAQGRVHFADTPGAEDARPVDIDTRRISVVKTVVVRENAMRSVIEKETRRQQQHRTDAINAAAAAEARADREKAAHCARLAKKVRQAERSMGSLLDGSMAAADDQYWQACRR